MKKILISALIMLQLSAISLQAQNSGETPGTIKQDTAVSDARAESTVFGSRIEKMYHMMLRGFTNNKLEYLEDTDAIQRIAKLTKNYYDALIEVGFTEEQAIEIVVESNLFSLPEAYKSD